MWAAGSIDEMRDMYLQQGRHVGSGVWSLLLSESASDSLEFAERYFQAFNEISLGSWHLNVFAKHNVRNGGWIIDRDLHQRSLDLRKKIEEHTGRKLPPLCIVFLSGPSFLNTEVDVDTETVWAVLPLDHKKIHDNEAYLGGLKATQAAITKCFRDLNIERYEPLDVRRSNSLIGRLQSELAAMTLNETISCYVFKPAKWVGLAMLSSVFGLPVNALGG